ncbi:hypothetical protein NC651_001582 [Populus alba x Populus x berolinensis]|nr:hypothetical protein NC651_001582 [Populus alba x Populus x berolinensis]
MGWHPLDSFRIGFFFNKRKEKKGPSFSTNPHQASTITPSTPALLKAIKLAFIALGLFKFPPIVIVSSGSITNTGTLESLLLREPDIRRERRNVGMNECAVCSFIRVPQVQFCTDSDKRPEFSISHWSKF